MHVGTDVSVELHLPVSSTTRHLDSMHEPDHSSVLPDHVASMPMPDSPREAELLVLLLEMGLYPQIVPAKNETIRLGGE